MNKPLSAYEVGQMSNWVYVMTAGPRHIKIGVSVDVDERVKSVQTGCPFKVRIVQRWRSPHARKIERAAHVALAKYRREGEWFDLPPKVAVEVVEWLIGAHPRNPITDQPRNLAIVFCRTCSHCVKLTSIPSITRRFVCSRCKSGENVHVIDTL